MEKIDYKKVGLKCGIEIHQQLEGKKLFCDCPTTIVDDAKFDVEITRRLRAVIGETGKIDQAAAHEMKKGKEFAYRAEINTSCLVDLDEEPPHTMNQEALNVALQVSLMLKTEIVDEVQIMRKTVVDGSNTTGFQRTALISQNGRLDTSEGNVGIQTVCLEEDAAKIVERSPTKDIYNLSRLGIPLVEIATDPDIISPDHCKETAEKIGMFLRSTGKAKRGLGTIRQDVNVSIKGGTRIEIKGAQDLKMIPTLVDYEVRRQMKLLEIKKKLGNISVDDKIYDITKIMSKCESKIIKSTLKKKGVVKAIKLKGFKGLIGTETQPGRRLGSEFSDYAKVKAGVGGLFHTDELPKYGITEDDVKKISEELKCADKDAFILIADKEAKVDMALDEVSRRVKLCEQGVMNEVRKANPDGTSSFMRPMPGAARMYPETDTTPIKTDVKHIKMPELLEEKQMRLIKSLSLGKDLAQVIAKSGKADMFEEFVDYFKKIKPAFIAETLFSTPKTLRRKHGVDDTNIKDVDFKELFQRLNNNDITKDSVEEILIKLCKNEKVDYKKYALMSDEEIEAEIKKILKESEGIEFKILVGKVMGTLKGKAEGKKIMDMLKKLS